MKKPLSSVLALLILSLPLASNGETNSPQGQPNVLFIAIDDLRCSIGAYGDPIAQTPNIDRLAAMGTAFTRAYVQQAVCSASRASVLTGCRPDTTTVDYPYNDYFNNEFLPNHPSIPLYFSNNGYLTRCGGKLHHSNRTGEYDDFDYEKEWLDKGHWRNYADPEHVGLPRNQQPAFEKVDMPDTVYRDGRLAASVSHAIDQYAKSDQSQPFFFATGFHKPHLPFNAPSEYWDLYDAEDFTLPENRRLAANVTALANASFELRNYRNGQIDFDDEDRLRNLTHGYYACVSFIDAQIGKLIDSLQKNRLLENTLIVLWSDHGFHLGENESFGKHTCFEAATRAPLIVVDSRLQKAQVCDSLVEFVDIFPTLCELANVPAPDYLEGDSLVPLLKDQTAPWKKAAYSQWPRSKDVEGFSVRTERYRYTEWRDRSKSQGEKSYSIVARELYDHQNDSTEAVNLADAKPQIVATLSKRLD
ncbi:MAG: sulfatase [Verrucomicrobiota bacterium]